MMDHFLLDMTIKATLVLGVTAGVATALRGSSAAVRHLTWATGLAAVVALPLLARLVPAWGLPILPSVVEAWTPATSAAAPEGVAWTGWLIAVWAAGALVVGAGILAGRLHVTWLARGAERLERGPWPALVTALSGEIDLSRPVAVRQIDRPIMPMVWGIARPVLMLPSSADAWPAALKRDVLVHELAHVKRHDALAQLIGRLACALHWFNPLAWIAARRLRIERERACDDQVLELGARPCDYADHLLTVARARASGGGLALALEMGGRSALGERLAALLDRHRRRSRLSARVARATLAGAVVLALPIAAIRPERTPATPAVAWAPEGPGIVPPPPSVNAGVQEKVRKPVRKPRAATAARSIQSKHDAFRAPDVAVAPPAPPRARAAVLPASFEPPELRRRVTVVRPGESAGDGTCDEKPERTVMPVQLVTRFSQPLTP